jgi:hypothetical protein
MCATSVHPTSDDLHRLPKGYPLAFQPGQHRHLPLTAAHDAAQLPVFSAKKGEVER